MIKFLGCKEIISEESVLYTRKRCVPHPACKVAIEKSLSSTQIAYRQQDNCTNTFIIYSTIPMSALKHTYQLRDMAITLPGESPYHPCKGSHGRLFAVIRAHQHGIAVESMNGRTRFFLFEATVRSEVQSHVTRLTHRHQHKTTVLYNTKLYVTI